MKEDKDRSRIEGRGTIADNKVSESNR